MSTAMRTIYRMVRCPTLVQWSDRDALVALTWEATHIYGSPSTCRPPYCHLSRMAGLDHMVIYIVAGFFN